MVHAPNVYDDSIGRDILVISIASVRSHCPLEYDATFPTNKIKLSRESWQRRRTVQEAEFESRISTFEFASRYSWSDLND